MLMMKSRVGPGQNIFCCPEQWIKNLLIHFWKRLVVTAKLIVPCYGVAAGNTVTIVAAYAVSVSSMDAQTNKLFLKKTRIKWTDSILVQTYSTTKDTKTSQYYKFPLKFHFCCCKSMFWMLQVTLQSWS